MAFVSHTMNGQMVFQDAMEYVFKVQFNTDRISCLFYVEHETKCCAGRPIIVGWANRDEFKW